MSAGIPAVYEEMAWPVPIPSLFPGAVARTEAPAVPVCIKTVAVTGAGGCVGQALLERLLGRYRVKALFRTQSDVARAWQARGCEVILGDLSDTGSLRTLSQEADVVFHCAATMDKNDPAKSHEVNVLGTRRLLAEAARGGCRLFVHISSISVYAATPSRDGTYTEDMEPENLAELNNYSRTKLLSELEVKRSCLEHSIPYVILRPTNVYGPHSRPWFLNIARLVTAVPLMVGDVEIDLVHVDDVAKAAVQAAESPRAFNQTFNLGHQRFPLREFMAAVARLLNRKSLFLPRAADRLLRRAIDATYAALAGTRMSLSLIGPAHYPTTKATTLFDYAPEIGIETGLRRTVCWFNERSCMTRQCSPRHVGSPRRLDAVETVRVRSEQDIVDAVGRAAASGVGVRAVGSMGSKNKNFHAPGTALDLREYNRLLSIDGHLVTVQAGMRLGDLYSALNAAGLALANVGEWSGATVAGAVSTGTHGGSVHHGSMPSLVDSMKVVFADGSARRIGADDALFDYVGLSLGVYGVISEITLRCVPRFRLGLEKGTVSLREFVAGMGPLNAGYPYWAGIWVPPAGSVLIYRAMPTPLAHSGTHRDRRFGMGNLGAYELARGGVSNACFRKREFRTTVVGDWAEVLAPIREGAAARYVRRHCRLPLEIEVAVPLGSAEDVLFELDALFRREGTFPSSPVGLRCGQAERFKLSPCYGRDSLWIALFTGNERLLSEASRLLAEYDCRFHWGKNVSLPPEYVTAQYESWEDVAKLKRRLDPRSLFSNSFTRRYGL